MPHRIPIITHTLGFIFEAIALGFMTAWQGFAMLTSLISDADWDKITGPHGVAFVACAACLVLWASAVNRDRKEDKRRLAEDAARERRHAETIQMQSNNADKLMEITVENAKVNMRVANAIHSLDQSIKSLLTKDE